MEKTIFRSVFVIIILGLIVYANSLNARFVWDDDKLVSENAYIRNWSYVPKIFTEEIGAGAGEEFNFYCPIQILTYRIDYALWRLREQGYHLTNILLHISVALAIYWFVNILYDDRFISLITSAFFVVHPVHTEAVAYVSGRADSLALLFMLLSIIFYIKNRDSALFFKTCTSSKIRRCPYFYFFALLCYISALLSREGSIILPVLLLLYHYTFNKRVTIKSFLPMLTVTVIYIALRITLLSSILPDLSPHPPLIQRIPAIFVAIANYARLLILPLNLHMEYGNLLFNFWDPKVILGILITAYLLAYAFKERKAKGLAFFSISWFFITLLPVSGIYPLSVYMAEHWLYLPSIGFFLILAKCLNFAYRNRNLKTLTVSFTVVLLCFYSYLTIRQCGYWKEPIFFYKRTMEYAPNSKRIRNNLGKACSDAGKYEEAISLYKKVLELDPDYVDAHYNLGTAYDAIGKPEEAIASYKKAIEIDPTYSKAYNNLGKAYSDIGEKDKVLAMYKKAIGLNPNYRDAYYNLGNEYRRSGKNGRAIELYKRALEIDPYLTQAHNNLAVVYFYEEQYDLAIQHCDRAIKLGLRIHPGFLKDLEEYR